MSKVYIAKNAIGQFNTGEEVVGLTDKDRIKYLLSIDAIVEKDDENADEDEGSEVVKLDKLTKAELIELLTEDGIEYNESDTKAELIALFPTE